MGSHLFSAFPNTKTRWDTSRTATAVKDFLCVYAVPARAGTGATVAQCTSAIRSRFVRILIRAQLIGNVTECSSSSLVWNRHMHEVFSTAITLHQCGCELCLWGFGRHFCPIVFRIHCVRRARIKRSRRAGTGSRGPKSKRGGVTKKPWLFGQHKRISDRTQSHWATVHFLLCKDQVHC